MSNRTILDAESGDGNPKFETLYQIVTYLKIPTNKLFYPSARHEHPNLQKLTMELSDCSEKEVEERVSA